MLVVVLEHQWSIVYSYSILGMIINLGAFPKNLIPANIFRQYLVYVRMVGNGYSSPLIHVYAHTSTLNYLEITHNNICFVLYVHGQK